MLDAGTLYEWRSCPYLSLSSSKEMIAIGLGLHAGGLEDDRSLLTLAGADTLI